MKYEKKWDFIPSKYIFIDSLDFINLSPVLIFYLAWNITIIYLFTLHLRYWVNWFLLDINCVITLLQSPSWLHQFVLSQVTNYILKKNHKIAKVWFLQKLWKIRSEPFISSFISNTALSIDNDNCKCLKVWQIHVFLIYLIFVYIYWRYGNYNQYV